MTDSLDNGLEDHSFNLEGMESDLQHEIDDALGELSLMDLVDEQTSPAKFTAEGIRRGKVVSVQRDDILVDMGGKSTGVLPVKQLGDEPLPNEGDIIEVMVTGYKEDEGLLLLSREDAVMAATWETLEVGQNVEGRVTGHNKGGLELTVDGIKAFMPISQIDRSRVEAEDISAFVSRRLGCKVMEIRRNERAIIVSRRSLMEEERAKECEQLLESLVEGQTVCGTVKSIMSYGAFVDIGGIDGLLHVGDMGYGRVQNPNDVVHQGQQLKIMVLKIDRENHKIALGLKQIMADPWTDAETKWPVDSVVKGRITRLMDFGAFLELEEGVEGLIPISEMTFERRINHPREVVKKDELVEVRVLSVDTERKRIGLSLKRVGDDPWMGASVRWPVDSVAEGTVKQITDFGAFVELAPGVEGLVHISEMSEGRIHSAGEVVQQGQVVQAKVISVDEERRRIALSIKQLATVSGWTGSADAKPEPSTRQRKRKKPLRGGLDR